MDPITALGAAAAASQFGAYGVKGLISLIRLVSHLRDTPPRIQQMLQDVHGSVTCLAQLTKTLQDPSSDIAQALTARQVQSIQGILNDGQEAMRNLQDSLKPLVMNKDGTVATGMAKAWKTVVGASKTKEVEEGLQRIQRLYSDLLFQLQVTDIELQIKLRTTSSRISRSIDDTLQGVQLLGTQIASVESANQSTDQKIQLANDRLSGIQLTTDSLVAGDMRIESSLNTMQPMLISLQMGHRVMHEGIENIDRALGTLNTNISTSKDILLALTDRQHQLIPPRNTFKLSSRDKADMIKEITTSLLASPSTLGDALKKKPGKKAGKYSVTIRLYPLLRKALQFTFAATFGSGGYSLHHSLHVYATVKRSESPLFRLLDRCLEDNWVNNKETYLADVARRAIHDLIDGMRRALAHGGCNLTDRDEEGRTIPHGAMEIFAVADFHVYDVAEEFLQFWGLLDCTWLDLSARAPCRNVFWVGARGAKNLPLMQDLTVQEFSLTILGYISQIRLKTGVLDQNIQRLESDGGMSSLFVENARRELPSLGSPVGLVPLLNRRPDLLELFSDSTGLGFAIVHKISTSLLPCYRTWSAAFSNSPELSVTSSDPRDTENVLWSLGYSPLALSVGWLDGLRILLEDGADPADGLSAAAFQDDPVSLQLLLDVQHPNAVTACDILKVFNELKHLLRIDCAAHLVHAVKMRRQMLSQLALSHLPETQHRCFGLAPDLVLDSNAFIVYNILINGGIEVPQALAVYNDKPVYHNDYFTRSSVENWRRDMWFDEGFREIDAKYGDQNTTPLYELTIMSFKVESILWFLAKGAEPRVHSQLSFVPGDAIPLALNLSDWFLFYRDNLANYLLSSNFSEADMGQIIEHYARCCTMPMIDGCTCFCSMGGCLPIHCFRRATYNESILPDWYRIGRKDERRLTRLSRWYISRILLIWCENAHLSRQEIQDVYTASCRLEMFERLGMAHTCLPHGVHPYLEPDEPLSGDEVRALQEEDEDSYRQLRLLLKAYESSRAMCLPSSPTPLHYHNHLDEWWNELEEILPEIDYDLDREKQVVEALRDAGYLKDLSDVRSERSHSSVGGIPDFEKIIQQHFAHYLTGSDYAKQSPETEDEWVTESEWETDDEI